MQIATLTELTGQLHPQLHPQLQPTVIFFDAVGTLFGVRDSVGEQYAKVAQKFVLDETVMISPENLDRAFYSVFKRVGNPAFPGTEFEQIPNLERQWWRSVVLETFQTAGEAEKLRDFDRFFEAVFEYFATAEPWTVYPDTLDALDRLQQQGITLGLISNFDSRLHTVLEALSLRSFFQSVTISTEVGTAKPDRAIFAAAIAKHSASFEQAWHVGDSRREDYEAAIACGMQGILIER